MIKAEIKDRELAIEILTQSFIDVMIPNSINFVVKNDANRSKRLRFLMAYQFDITMMLGSVFFSDDKKACVLYIDQWKNSLRKLFLEVKLLFNVIGVENLFKVLKREKLLKSFHPKGKFTHLWLMGVVPLEQGKGTGSRLIQETLKVKNEKLVYLETTTQENLNFYKKNGFKIFHETFELDYPLYFLNYVRN